MTGLFLQHQRTYSVIPVFCFVLLSTFGLYPSNAITQQINIVPESKKELYYNLDCTDFFWCNDIPNGKAGATIDQYIDVVAEAGVTTFLCNINARRTNYRSLVWESFWDGYDTAGPDNQLFLNPIPCAEVKKYRNGIHNMLAVHEQETVYPARVIERCRFRGMSPWITLRMNDCHHNAIPDHPFHGSFWKKNRHFYIKNRSDYFATCLDYAHAEVRDHYMSLINEVLNRFDIDGLELDFLREPYLFSRSEEAEGLSILNKWMREVRRRVDLAAAKQGHHISLGVRVPSHPEVAMKMGLDAVTWAKEDLIDLLVVSPRWASIEFDMPIEEWKLLLGTSKTKLVGGLEIRYQPYPGASASNVSPELATGAAVSVLSRGADAVYLFNYFQDGPWPLPVYKKTLNAMTSLDSLMKLPRRIGVTYRDITAPGEKSRAPLPMSGNEIAFPMKLGPIPDDSRCCELLIEIATTKDTPECIPLVSVNGQQCAVSNTGKAHNGRYTITCNVPITALLKADFQSIRITGKDEHPLTILRLEMALDTPGTDMRSISFKLSPDRLSI